MVVIARDMDMAIPAPSPCTALSRIIALRPRPGKVPQSPMAREETVNTEIPVTNTLLYPMLVPIFDHRRMKQVSIRV